MNGALLDAAQAQFVAQLYREEGSIWVGEQIFTMPTFYLKDETGKVMRFDHLRVMSNSHIVDRLLRASLDIEADNIEINQQVIDQLRFDLELSDFASEPLLALSQLMHQPQPWSADQRQKGFELMTAALLPGADIELDYRLNMQNEQVLLRGMLNFPNISDTASKDVTANAQQLLQHLNSSLEFKAPQVVVKDLLFDMTWSALTQQMGQQAPNADQEMQIKQMTENQVAGLVTNGVLVAQDSNYLLEFDYHQGQMVLNEKPISQGEIFLLLMLLLQVTPDESTTP
jgi:uncharacterized protein YdgA (DUF945 family)